MLTTTVAGRTWDFSHAIGRNAATGAGFNNPYDVAIAPDGVLYVINRGQEGAGGVVMENKRIGKATIDQEFIGEFGRQEFTWPAGIALSQDGQVYISDEFTHNIAIYSSAGERLSEWGEEGAEEGQLNGPSGIAFDDKDNLYIVDSLNDRVQKFTKDGSFLLSWGSSGSGEGQFNRPWGIAVDGNSDVYVVDWGNDRVQKFSSEGAHLRTFGASKEEGGDLNHPAGVAVDSEGDVYVTDWGNKRVQIYDAEGSILTALYGDAQEFSKWAKEVIESNPDSVKAYRRVQDRTTLGLFERPVGIIIDDQDRIIITDSTRGRLQIYAKQKDFMEPQFNL